MAKKLFFVERREIHLSTVAVYAESLQGARERVIQGEGEEVMCEFGGMPDDYFECGVYDCLGDGWEPTESEKTLIETQPPLDDSPDPRPDPEDAAVQH